jgi:hypothetical protein
MSWLPEPMKQNRCGSYLDTSMALTDPWAASVGSLFLM